MRWGVYLSVSQLCHNVYRKLRVFPITEVYWVLLRTSSLVVGGDSQVVENLRRQLCAPRHHSAQTRVWWEHIGRPDEEVQAPGGRGERGERRRNSYETGGSLKLSLPFKKHWFHHLTCNVNWCTLHTHAKIILTLSCVQTLWPTKSVSCYISCFYFSLGVLCIRQLFLLHFEMFPWHFIQCGDIRLRIQNSTAKCLTLIYGFLMKVRSGNFLLTDRKSNNR